MLRVLAVVLVLSAAALVAQTRPQPPRRAVFQVEEATIAGIQQALAQKQVTTVGVVEQYLWRVQAYNGTCVNQPQGILGPITTMPHARQINALVTLNLRPSARARWGFDARKARSLTDSTDNHPSMPDALETAAAQDAQLARTGRLVAPSTASCSRSKTSTTPSTCGRPRAATSTTPTIVRPTMRRS